MIEEMDKEEENVKKQMLNPSAIKLTDKIGKGCQGVVYKGKNVDSDQFYAVKILNINHMKKKEKQRLYREININFQLSLKKENYFPFFYGFWEDKSNIYLAFQECECNALQSMSSDESIFSKYSFIYVLLYDMLKALEILHSQNIVHRDIKLQNILLKQGSFKLCDLGLSRNLQQAKRLTIEIGNIIAKAPQVYNGEYNEKVDIWSLGVTIYMVAFGCLPFDLDTTEAIKKKNIGELIQRMSENNFQIKFIEENRLLLNIMKDMIIIDQQKRMSASKILQKYFKDKNRQFFHKSRFLKAKSLFLKYLSTRQQSVRQQYYFLILFILFVDFTKIDKSLVSDPDPRKKQVCLRVKLHIYYCLKYIYKDLKCYEDESELIMFYEQYLLEWETELKVQKTYLISKSISSIKECLQLHKMEKIAKKFPLLPIAVEIFEKTKKGNKIDVYLWNIPIDLRKLFL